VTVGFAVLSSDQFMSEYISYVKWTMLFGFFVVSSKHECDLFSADKAGLSLAIQQAIVVLVPSTCEVGVVSVRC
jgi:hypothetical protein